MLPLSSWLYLAELYSTIFAFISTLFLTISVTDRAILFTIFIILAITLGELGTRALHGQRSGSLMVMNTLVLVALLVSSGSVIYLLIVNFY